MSIRERLWRMLTRKRVFFLLGCLVIYGVLMGFYIVYWGGKKLIRRKSNGKKWAIITTIHLPTESVMRLVELGDWEVVIVGDTKTPVDYPKYRNLHYLSVENQKSLGYEILNHIPWKHYSRKNIGYLYAISKGAELIYETDDDNLLKPTELGLICAPEHTHIQQYRTSLSVANPYEYFGIRNMLPRGYPRDLPGIHTTTPFLCPSSKNTLHVPIQQYLQDVDPDVDAIYRLTHRSEIGQFQFTPNLPPIALPSGTYSPFNSQNTFFYSSAFWALLIPVSVNFRVCDIWRGYFSQRLLWDLGGSLLFGRSTVDHFRNAHRLVKDYKDEEQLYSDTRRLLSFLSKWRGRGTMGERMEQLGKELESEKFVGKEDVALVGAWVRDLGRVGYKWPEVKKKEVKFLNRDTWCGKDRERVVLRDVLVVFGLALPVKKGEGMGERMRESKSRLESRYKGQFPHMAFYSDISDVHVEGVRQVPSCGKDFAYTFLLDAMERYRGSYEGYLYVGPGMTNRKRDVENIVSNYNLNILDRKKIYFTEKVKVHKLRWADVFSDIKWKKAKDAGPSLLAYGRSIMHHLRERVDQRIMDSFKKCYSFDDPKEYSVLVTKNSGLVYVPVKYAKEFVEVGRTFAKHFQHQGQIDVLTGKTKMCFRPLPGKKNKAIGRPEAAVGGEIALPMAAMLAVMKVEKEKECAVAMDVIKTFERK